MDTLEMLLDIKKASNTRLSALAHLCFSQILQRPACFTEIHLVFLNFNSNILNSRDPKDFEVSKHSFLLGSFKFLDKDD